MTTPDEFKKNVTLSVGGIVFIITATFFITTFYHKQNTLESRIEKKYNRLEEKYNKLEEKYNEYLEEAKQCP